MYNDIHRAPDVAQHEIYREVAIQSSLQHPNIIHLFGAFQVSGRAHGLTPTNLCRAEPTSQEPSVTAAHLQHVC